MADDTLLYMACPNRADGASTTHDTARGAAGPALVFEDGSRVVVLEGRTIIADVSIQAPKNYRDETHALACLDEAEGRIAEAVADAGR